MSFKNKRKELLATLLVIAPLALSGCNGKEAQDNGVAISYEVDNHDVLNQIRQEKRQENEEIQIARELMEKCEILAAQEPGTPDILTIIDSLEQENREKDLEEYTKWTNPKGELLNPECRLAQEMYNLLRNTTVYNFSKTEGGYIIKDPFNPKDLYPSRFITEYGYIESYPIKTYLLPLCQKSFNEFMDQNGLDCQMKYAVKPTDSSEKSDNPAEMQLEVDFIGTDVNKVASLTIEIEKTMKCIAWADELSEIRSAALDVVLYSRAIDNYFFAGWIWDCAFPYTGKSYADAIAQYQQELNARQNRDTGSMYEEEY